MAGITTVYEKYFSEKDSRRPVGILQNLKERLKRCLCKEYINF